MDLKDFARLSKAQKKKVWRALTELQRIELYNAVRAEQSKVSVMDYGRNIFAECKVARTPKKFRNRWSSEQAGRIGWHVCTRKVGTATIVCKSRELY